MLTTTDYQQQLMRVFYFDEADLEANQAGRLSERQQKMLKVDKESSMGAFILVILLSVGAALILLLSHISSAVTAILFAFGIIGAVVVSLLLMYMRLTQDLQSQEPIFVMGKAQIERRRRYGVFVRISNVSFPVNDAQTTCLKEGDYHCIYYAGNSKRILSVEWLASNTSTSPVLKKYTRYWSRDEGSAVNKSG